MESSVKKAKIDYLLLAKQWLEWGLNAKTCAKLKGLIDQYETEDGARTLQQLFQSRIQFGTAGLRAGMDVGPTMMNDLVVTQTTQGLYEYLVEVHGEAVVKERGVVIGFDHRANKELDLYSFRFAICIALVFLTKSVKVFLFEDICPTPFVAYSVVHTKAVAGIMITASHNPKADNGYKLYWENGCQIIPPHDKNISAAILRNLKPTASMKEVLQGLDLTPGVAVQNLQAHYSDSALLTIVDPSESELITKYYKTVVEKLCRNPETNAATNLKIMYTPMHGVGEKYTMKMLRQFGFKEDCLFSVPEQKEPDPDFPTVKFPNPEEDHALDLAMQHATEVGATLVVANDPDADRLAIAVKCPSNETEKQWTVLSGNELGAIFACWQLEQFKKGVQQNKPAIVVSTVSSKLVRAICQAEGVIYKETLTGFKWVGNKHVELSQTDGVEAILGYEEAIGFCLGDIVSDKDGISAAGVLCELASHLHSMTPPKTLQQYLEEIHQKYGYYVGNNGYLVIHDDAIKEKLLERAALLKEGDVFGSGGQVYKVTKVRNEFPGTNLVMFVVEGGIDVTLRPSGTEPKFKYYTEISGKEVGTLQEDLNKFVVAGLIGDLLKV